MASSSTSSDAAIYLCMDVFLNGQNIFSRSQPVAEESILWSGWQCSSSSAAAQGVQGRRPRHFSQYIHEF